MSIILELPEELASRLAALLPEGERDQFALSAIEAALAARRRDEEDARLAATLSADLDPVKEPERNAAECIAVVEAELEDMQAGRGVSYSLEEMSQRWEAMAARRASGQK